MSTKEEGEKPSWFDAALIGEYCKKFIRVYLNFHSYLPANTLSAEKIMNLLLRYSENVLQLISYIDTIPVEKIDPDDHRASMTYNMRKPTKFISASCGNVSIYCLILSANILCLTP